MTDKIHIVRATISNFMRLKAAAVEFDPEKGLHRVTGKNGAGKTSLLAAIHAAFGGAGAVPDQPIHDIEDESVNEGSFIQVDLSNGYSIERRFTEAGTYLSVVSPDGGKYGQTKINEWVGRNSFDPMGFFGLKPKEAKEVLLSLSPDPHLPDKLADLDDRRQELFDERTPYISRVQGANKVTEPTTPRPDPVDVSGDTARLEALQQIQRAREDANKSIAERELKIKEYKETIRQLEERLARGRAMLEEAEQNQEAEVALRASMEDPSEEIRHIKSRLGAANETSAVLERWRRYDAAMEALEEARERRDEITRLIDEIDREKSQLLADAGPPIDGLTFDAESGEPTLNGRPLAQASGAERIGVAVAVALIANPDLAVCLVDEANDLDLDSMAALDALAKEHEFQILACRIGLEGPGDVVVEDGVAKGGSS